MLIQSIWGGPIKVTEVLSGVMVVAGIEDKTKGGIVFTQKAAITYLSEVARSKAEKFQGLSYFKENFMVNIPLFDSQEVLNACIEKANFFAGRSEESISKHIFYCLSLFSPMYLQAVGVEPDKAAFDEYNFRKEHKRLTDLKDPNAVISFTDSSHTFLAGIVRAYTADGESHLVKEQSLERGFEDARIGMAPLLSDFDVVAPDSVPPVSERLIPYARHLLNDVISEHEGRVQRGRSTFICLLNNLCYDMASLSASTAVEASIEGDMLRLQVEEAGIVYPQ